MPGYALSKRIPTAGVEEAPARFPQAGNNLWITAQPPGVYGSCPVRRAGPHPPIGCSTMEGTLGSAKCAPLRGGSQAAVLPEGLAKVGSPGAGLAQAASPGGFVTGVRFVHLTERRLPPFRSRARDRRCPGHEGRGNQPRSEQSRRGVLEPAKAVFEPLNQGSSAVRALKGAWSPRRRITGATSGSAPMGFGRSRSCS